MCLRVVWSLRLTNSEYGGDEASLASLASGAPEWLGHCALSLEGRASFIGLWQDASPSVGTLETLFRLPVRRRIQRVLPFLPLDTSTPAARKLGAMRRSMLLKV